MTWTLDVDGNLINLDHFHCITMQERDKTCKERYQILALSENSEFILARCIKESDAKEKLEYYTDLLV